MAFQAIQIVLALGIVVAYASIQLGLARPEDLRYVLTNLVCAAGLTVTAVLAFQLGFVISNGLWVVISATGLIRLSRGRRRGDR